LLLDDAENSDKLHSVSRSDLISQLSINCDLESSRHFSRWNKFWSLLQFKRLLVEEFAFFSDDSVGVERATGPLVGHRVLGIRTLSAGLSSTETKLDVLAVSVFTCRALPRDLSRLDRGATGRGNDTWHTDQLAHHLARQVSKIARSLITEDLDLPVWDGVVNVTRDCLVIVVVVNLLRGGFEHRHYRVGERAEGHRQSLVEVQQQLHAHLNVKVTLSGIPLQFLPKAQDHDIFSD